eukprot:TRINITY_DN5806_c0_g1_i1.p1 TRINITY_DN5806_c0_g1~~TRINITY_DN5806_c0_g1_i1.p1  ORF type:complete len:333 (+),score=85.94 TRINITY_DN5806_c0_g1_i1:191-1189(+)
MTHISVTIKKPDVVVLTGDSVSGPFWDGSIDWYESLWTLYTTPMREMGIRWAYAHGNHDGEGDLSALDIVKMDKSDPLSLSDYVDGIRGSSNFFIPILNPQNQTVSVLYVFDSGRMGCYGLSGYECVYPDQIQWYQNVSENFKMMNGNKPIPSMAFFHIPFPEYLDMYNTKRVRGHMKDAGGVCCSGANTGLFDAMKKQQDVKAVFVGHDHENDFIGEYEGITLAYGRKTGVAMYGPSEGVLRGARIIEIDTNNGWSFSSWIRQEDETIDRQNYFHEPEFFLSAKLMVCCGVEPTDMTRFFAGLPTMIVGTTVTVGLIGFILTKKIREKQKT